MTKALTIVAFLSGLGQAHASVPSLSAVALSKVESSTAMMLDRKTGTYCTVFPVSEDGYLLTAVHCLKRCLEDAESDPHAKPGAATSIVCKDQTIPALNVSEVQVVAQGSTTEESRFGDYAVLKVEAKKSLRCLKLAEKSVASGKTIWAMGFPTPKAKGQIPTLDASAGQLYTRAEESRFYKAQKTDRDRKNVAQLYSEPGVLYSNAHHMPGQSGGPVVSEDATVIGVVSGFTVTRSGKKEIHELVASSTEKILKSLPPSLSTLLVQKSTACN
jgi:V8-like Glu-specific endopeptidase